MEPSLRVRASPGDRAYGGPLRSYRALGGLEDLRRHRQLLAARKAKDFERAAGADVGKAESCNCGAASVGGYDPDRPKVNQDACYVEELPDGRLQAAIFDGHGKKGHVVSGALKELLPPLMVEQLATEDAATSLVRAFEASDAALRTASVGTQARTSGAAAVAAIVEQGSDDKAWAASVACAGDSRAILVELDGGQCIARQLSETSSCERAEERERIEARGGAVRNGVAWAGPIGVAMSRALGDLVLRPFGVIATPEVSAASGTRAGFLLLVTDGISDVFSNDDAAQLVCDHLAEEAGDFTGACSKLVETARDRWQADLPIEVRIDDASAVLIPLQGK
eukprot:s2293_g1.t1